VEVWKFQPGNLDMVNGAMFVDYDRNQLVVGSWGSGDQTTLWILDTRTGALLQSFSLGNIDQPISFNAPQTHAYVVNNAGTAHSIDLTNLTVAWSGTVGAPNSFLWPTAGAFYLTTSDGQLKKFQDNGSSAPTPLWSTAVAGVSGATLSAASGKLYVGSNQGRLYEIDPTTGTLA
jgi:outer membrane protein assembly factor BamB